jgi:hypothetical protein
MSIPDYPDYPYEHILFYDDHEQAEKALEHVITFDGEAELNPLSGDGHAYVVRFATDSEFTQEEAHELAQLLSPDEYGLNYYPWGEEEEDEEE